MKGTFMVSGLLASTVSAHMQLSKPYPIRSPLNKDADGQKDYSYTNPLSSSGSDYPCKGYAKDEFKAVDTWAPGSSQEMTLEGSATHDGGSCQLALTYDQGATFKVIESIEGDCPIAKDYKFNIPADAPAGDALFAWTWFNKVGNREMYMNCAMITIGGGGERAANATTDAEERGVPKHMLEMAADDKTPVSKAMEEVAKAKEAANLKDNAKPMEESKPMDNTKPMESTKPMASIKPMENAKPKEQSKPKGHAKQSKAADSFDSLPDLFVANVDQAGKCVTIEGEAVNFPKPGPNVIGKADGKGYKCEGNAPFLDADSQTTKNATSTDKKMSKIASSFGTSTATAGARTLSTEATTSNQFSNYVGQWSCTDGEILCSPDGMSFAMCNYGRPVFMGSVAAGTWCRWGAITARW